MFYVLQHIFMCLLAATALGALIAWLWRGSGFSAKLAALEEEWSGKLGLAEADKNKVTAQWKESESLATTLRQKFAALEGDHTRLQSDFAGVSSRLPMLETAIAGWTAKAATWDSDRTRMQADLRACADARAALEVQVADWTSRGKAWDTERSTLRANLNKAVADDAADDAAYERTITALRADVSGLQLRLKNAEIAANDWQVKCNALDGQIKSLMAERDRALLGYKKAVADDAADDAAYEKTIAALRADQTALQAQLAAVTKERDQAQAGHTKALADDQADDAAYEKTIAALRGQLVTLTEERDQARAGFNRAVKDDAADDAHYEKVIAQLRGEIANLKAASKQATNDDTIEDANFRNAIEGLRAEVAGLQAKLKREHQADREDDAAYEKTIAGLQAQIATLTQERDQARAGFHRAVQDDAADDAQYEKVIAQLRGEIANLKGAAQQAADADAMEAANLRNTIEGLRTEVAGLQAKLKREQQADREDDAAYEKTIAGFQAQLDALTQERDQTRANYQKAVQDDQARHAEYEKVTAQLRAEITSVQAKFKADAASDTRIAELNAALAAARGQVQTLEAKFAAPAAMAAAAGVGAAATSLVDDGRFTTLSRRFESFVMRTQREGWGDIERIQGIGPVYGQKLRSAGIAWVKDLLEEGGAPAGRVRLAEETGIKRELILKWVNAADLLRITTITPDWAELLEASGVDTVKELRNRVPENLQKKMAETNPVGNYARTVPDTATVAGWVEAAKKMEPKVTH